jgi:hypothetical protein
MESNRTKVFSMIQLSLLFAFVYSGTWQEGAATHFQAIGSPYGACGVPESVLAKENALDYIALNVFDAPGDYRSPGDFGSRPLTGDALSYLGAYANGANCGRWVEIELGDDCTVANGGEAGNPICGDGVGWKADSLNGAKLFAIVTDQCSDNNAWCRDNPGHIDLHTPALNHFKLPGGELIPPYAIESNGFWTASNYNNRKVKWRFISAPNISGDIHIYFAKEAKPGWRSMYFTNLPNGIHGVEQWDGTQWVAAQMSGDMGQMFVLPRPDLPEPHKIRILDANDQLVYAGREYSCSLPAECVNGCPNADTPATCTAAGGSLSILTRQRPATNPRRFYLFNLLGQLKE